MVFKPVDDEEDQRVGITGIPPALQRIPRFSNPDNLEVSDSEFNPPPAKQTFPVPDAPGAPVDFPGVVLPNTDNVQPRWDAEGTPPDPTTIDSKMTYVNAPKISTPAPTQGVNVPPISPQYQRDLAQSENLGKGSGVDQFQQNHHILGGILKGLDIAGSFLAPNLAVNIPGTTLHHQLLEMQNRGNLNQDIQNQERQVQTGHQQAETEHTQAETGAIPAQTAERQAQASRLNAETEALSRPQSNLQKMDDGSIVQITTDKDTGKAAANVLYKGDPKLETKVVQRKVNGVLRNILINDKTGADIKDLGETKMPNENEGSWQVMEDGQGGQVLFNPKTRQTVAPPQTLNKTGTYEKQHGPAEDAQRYADMYMNGNNFTAAGDEALMEKYFELAKPSSGFRMSEPQMQMLNQGRSWMEGIKAKVTHLFSPNAPYFSDEQRRQIVNTMKMVAAAKNANGPSQNPSPPAGATHIAKGSDNRNHYTNSKGEDLGVAP